MKKARHIATVTVMDPVYKAPVEIGIYRDPISGGMFGVDASYVEQVSDRVVPPTNNDGQIVILSDSAPRTPFKVAYVFGESDARRAVDAKWRDMDNDPCEYAFATQEELNAFCLGVNDTVGWLGCQGLEDRELKACKRARGGVR